MNKTTALCTLVLIAAVGAMYGGNVGWDEVLRRHGFVLTLIPLSLMIMATNILCTRSIIVAIRETRGG